MQTPPTTNRKIAEDRGRPLIDDAAAAVGGMTELCKRLGRPRATLYKWRVTPRLLLFADAELMRGYIAEAEVKRRALERRP